MKKFFRIFLYVSIVFLIIALAKADYLKIPIIYSYSQLALSLLFLFLSFGAFVVRWRAFLIHSDFKVTYNDSLISLGITIFGKYIPGKVMVIIGQSLYFSNKYNYSAKKISVLAVQNQIQTLWFSIILGIIPLFFVKQNLIHPIFIALTIVVFGIIAFTEFFHNPLNQLLSKILKREIKIPQLSFKSTLQILPSALADLLFKALGFYFLVEATTLQSVTLEVGLFYLLAQTMGIVALFSPGGIGVREGVLVALLALLGIGLADSVTISVTSRLWFLIGEFVFFIVAFVVNYFSLKQHTNEPR